MRRSTMLLSQFIACCTTTLCCLFLTAGQGDAASAPGPDGYDYTSDDTITYDWVEISATGTQIPQLGDDDHQGPFPIDFGFIFYDTVQSELYIQSNGVINFSDTSVSYKNSCPLPTADPPLPLIALMWDDLDPGDSNDPVYYQNFGAGSCPYQSYAGKCMVVQYDDFCHWLGGPTCTTAGTFEAILFDDHSIIIQIKDAGDEEGSWSTTGIQGNNTGDDHGLSYVCDTANSLTDGLAVKFIYGGPSQTVLNPDEQTVIDCPSINEHTFDYELFLLAYGSEQNFNMTYTITSGNGTLSGPATMTVADNSMESFQVNMTSTGKTGDVVTATVTASGAGKTVLSTIIRFITGTTFEPIADIPTPRDRHVSAAYDGKIWAIAGDADGGDAPVETYDPATDSWQIIADSLPNMAQVSFHSGCQAGDTVYMWYNDLWSYNMATNTWSNLSGASDQPDSGDWNLNNSAWVYDTEAGLCYATGGSDDVFEEESKKVFVYQPSDNSWLTPLPDFTTRRNEHAAWIMGSGAERKLCIAGGDVFCGSFDKEDPECVVIRKTTQCLVVGASAWNAENGDIGELPIAIEESGYAKVQGGESEQLWLVGGDTDDYSLNSGTGYYDVAAAAWFMGPQLAESVSWTEAVVLNNEMYQLSGYGPNNERSKKGNKLVPCKSCFPWTMFMPAITGMNNE